jgi:uncharacterized protein (TIGR02001 family)
MAVSRTVTALCGAAGVALVSLSGAAQAEEFTYSFSATGTSDYVFRGISQSDNDPAIQGAVDVGYGMFYAGVWASSIDFEADNNIEVDYYAGITPTWGPVTFDFGVIYYNYPDATEEDYLEWKAGASGELMPKLSAGATVYYTDDDLYDWVVYEGTLAYELPKTWVFTPTVSGLVGYTDFQDTQSGGYTYWNAGLGLAVENISFDFRYWDTDIAAADCITGLNGCSEKFVFSVGVSLP